MGFQYILINLLLQVDIIKNEVREMGVKLNALQSDIKMILANFDELTQLIRSPSPKDSTEELVGHYFQNSQSNCNLPLTNHEKNHRIRLTW